MIVDFVKESSSSPITEKNLTDEVAVFENELKDDYENGRKDQEEELIDHDINNSGLRRFTKYTMEEEDKDDDIEDDDSIDGISDINDMIDGKDDEPEEEEEKEDL